MRAALVLAVALLAACGGVDNGYAVDLTVDLDASVSDAAVSEIVTVFVDVSGDEMGHYSLEKPFQANPFGGRREERLIYRPRVPSGMLTFQVDAYDRAGRLLAFGSAGVRLKPSATTVVGIRMTPPAGPQASAVTK
jgi:hypothetical protein